ncbi:putative calcium-transporting ATPase 13, plasma membrane-type [Cornus florida]|uniref:putative calcium-transporting ATPase 13, plasma membrane-type n=1 Tax=Cornus florida TaxID=4283 RepID=UPI002899129C|nr:putative calcium-transporting ATPase 13, plasma membrane-type [Cornus florida]
MLKVESIHVKARSSAFDKLLMAQCLKKKGHIVAVTSDGNNTLKDADIGLSVGIQGTEVAKESSDIIILDDNFSSLVTVLRWRRFKDGRMYFEANVEDLNLFKELGTGNHTSLIIPCANLLSIAFTAKAIAIECGILKPYEDSNDAVVEGARSSPFDKLLTVQCLKKKGHLIAVTSDGNNDAPTLKEADIGLSMGIQGKEVAKESSDIVIWGDNFSSLVTVLRWGRCVYNNIQKFHVNEKVKDTLINFNSSVLCQVFSEFNARKLEKKNILIKGKLKNKLFLGIVGMTVVLQVVMMELPKRFANTERLKWDQWCACIGTYTASSA